MFSRRVTKIVIIFMVLAILIPWLDNYKNLEGLEQKDYTIFCLNTLGWLSLIFTYLKQEELKKTVLKAATDLNIDTWKESLESLSLKVINEIQRKNSSLTINIVERKISSKEELSRTLERIVALAYRLLNAESAELALFDADSSTYHSSFVLGKPFATASQAMLSGAVDGQERDIPPDILVQPIVFAGTVFGSLRVALGKGEIPSVSDQEIMRIIALQSGLAILNASYTDELLRMKRFSGESVKERTGFLANLSHEIRGPLGMMLNAIELVMDGLCGAISQDQFETLKMVKVNGEHLLNLINDVLDYAKIESGKVVPHPEDVVVSDLLKDMQGIISSQAKEKSHTLKFREITDVLTIRVDHRHVRQMMINLLTNAVKYTPDGGTIEVWAEKTPGNLIKLNVRDSGIGIEASARDKVFSAFERIENAYSINQVGAGLGMAVTKKLAEANGGSVDFSSVAGQGTHFWLLLPASQINITEDDSSVNEAVDVKGNSDLILLLESNPSERKVISRYLIHLGFNVSTVENQSEAIEVLKQLQVKLVMLDNTLIDKHHEEMVDALRKASTTPNLPIVLVSTRAFNFDTEKYLKLGIDLCLSKPIPLRKLAMICRKVIDGESNIT